MKNSNLKWLLLLPVLVVAVVVGFVAMKLMTGDSSADTSTTDSQASPALQVQLSDIQDRINAYNTLIERNASDLEAIRGLGDSYLEQGQAQGDNNQVNDSYRSYKNAIDQYRKYLSIEPTNVEVRIDLGLSYSYLQMVDIALRELHACVAAAPDNQRAWHSLGWVEYNGAGDLAAARDAWTKSYNLNPSTSIGQESKSFLDQFQGQQ